MNKPFLMQRDQAMDQLRNNTDPFDVVIVGGGATGLGAAVDAVTRGYRVALIEQSDFGAGTSSRSTKLVHGGVRYLQQGNISLVMSALRERGRMLRNAPHLVRSMPFVIPNYTRWEGPYYRFGMALYDRLAGRWSFGRSRLLNRRETLEHLPTLEPTKLASGVLYYDGQFDDARLAITLAKTAAAQGAALANYCRCVGLWKENGIVAGVLARDLESGAEFRIRGKTIINATGVFVDGIRRMDQSDAAPLVTVSQGVHVVLPKRFLPGNSAMMIPKTSDGRVLFAIPWHDRIVVGTTDTPGIQPSMTPVAQPAELRFILEHAGRYLVEAPSEVDVLSAFTGLRPLVKRGGGPTAALSRDHTIAVSESRLITITGGKWTTYRKMAEDVIDYAEKLAGREHRICVTADMALYGVGEISSEAGPLRAYGSDGAAVATLMRLNTELARPVHPRLSLVRAEVVWHARAEMARTVEDVLARRSRSLVLDARAAIEAAPLVARILAQELNHSELWIADQVQAFTSLAQSWLIPGADESAGIVAKAPFERSSPTKQSEACVRKIETAI